MKKTQLLFIALSLACTTAIAQTAPKAKAKKPQKQQTCEKPVIPPPVKDEQMDAPAQNNVVDNTPASSYTRPTTEADIYALTDEYLRKILIPYTDTCKATGQKPFLVGHFDRKLDEHEDISPLTYKRTMRSVIYTFNKERYLEGMTEAAAKKYVYPYDEMISVDVQEKAGVGSTPFISEGAGRTNRVYFFR